MEDQTNLLSFLKSYEDWLKATKGARANVPLTLSQIRALIFSLECASADFNSLGFKNDWTQSF